MSNTSVYLSWCLVLAAATATDTAARAGSPRTDWRLNRRSVSAPLPRLAPTVPQKASLGPAQAPKIDFFLAANPQSIEASLAEAGWQQIVLAAESDEAHSSAPLARLAQALEPLPDVLFAPPGGLGALRQVLVLWRCPESGGLHDPLPAWAASLIGLQGIIEEPEAPGPLAATGCFAAPASGDLLLCRDAADGLIDILLDGEARTLLATGPNRASVPFVEMRHAGAEMRQMLAAAAATATPEASASATCPAQLLLPSPKPPPMPLPQTVFWHDGVTPKRVALTFDACSTFGHGDYNPAVIAVLEQMQVPATLFIGGHWAEMHPEVLQALASNPLFEIGNHTYSHPHMRDLSPEAQKQELLWTQEAIFSRTGVLPRFFRPPYGEVDDTLIASVADAGLMTVEYDLPAGDADFHVGNARLIDWVVGRSVPGSIVVMHMNHPGNKTAQVLPAIVDQLRRRGLVLSSIGGMLAEHHL